MARLETLMLFVFICGNVSVVAVSNRFLPRQRRVTQMRQMLNTLSDSEFPEVKAPNELTLSELKRAFSGQRDNKMSAPSQMSRNLELPVARYEPHQDDAERSYDEGDCRDSTYGCCEDGKTLADGPRKKGCAMKLCFDNVVCDEHKIHCDNSNEEMRNFMRENCPFTCGYCKPASPRMTCEQNNPTYGCCWNGQEATGPNQCPPCEDVYPRACFLWRDDCGKGNFYGVRLFLGQSCPKTCGKCNAEEAG